MNYGNFNGCFTSHNVQKYSSYEAHLRNNNKYFMKNLKIFMKRSFINAFKF